MLPSKLYGGALLALLVFLTMVGAAQAASPGVPVLKPNDPGYVQDSMTYDQIDMPAFWAATVGRPCNAAIAIVDSGVGSIADLPQPIVSSDFTSGGDYFPHGTEVASVASGLINNGNGIPGISDCPIVSSRIVGSSGAWNDIALSAGINWAINQPGVRVLNLSLNETAGQTVPSDITSALQAANDHGILVVLITGNGTNNTCPGTSDPSANPLAASDPNAIRVAGTDQNGQIASCSDHGSALADIAAPYFMPTDMPDGSWAINNGTSFAAPVIAAVAAEMFNFNPSLSPAQVKQMLMSSGTRLSGLDVNCSCQLDAYNAYLAAGYVPPTASLSVVISGGGSVTANTEDLSGESACDASCSLKYDVGLGLTLTATASNGYSFASWSGICRSSSPSCTFSVSSNAALQATFVRTKAKLTVKKLGKGMVTSSPAGIECGSNCSANFYSRSVVKLKAKPTAGDKFVRWRGACKGTKPVCVLKASTTTVTAVFN